MLQVHRTIDSNPSAIHLSRTESVFSYGSEIETDDTLDKSWLSVYASRILYARAYLWLYLALSLINLFLLVFGLVHHKLLHNVDDEDAWYIGLDIFCSAILALEVLIRICAGGKIFFRNILNVIDLIVLVFCVASLSFYFVDPESAVIGPAVLVIRYIAQLARLALAFKHGRDMNNATGTDAGVIDFEGLNPATSSYARMSETAPQRHDSARSSRERNSKDPRASFGPPGKDPRASFGPPGNEMRTPVHGEATIYE